jgi:hypothetical protein
MLSWDLILQTWWPFVLLMLWLCTKKNVGAVSLLEEFIERQMSKHLQVLCSKVLKFEHVMSLVVSIVNYLCSRGLS